MKRRGERNKKTRRNENGLEKRRKVEEEKNQKQEERPIFFKNTVKREYANKNKVEERERSHSKEILKSRREDLG